MNRTFRIFFVLVALIAWTRPALAQDAKEAIQKASASGQYLLLAFYETTDDAFVAMTSAAETLITSSDQKITFFGAKMDTSDNKTVAEKYGVQTIHLPILLVIAPNGAITGGFPKTVTPEKLEQSVHVSDLMLKTLQPLQDQKIVLVSLRNSLTKHSEASWKGVNDFVTDPQYQQITTAISADPAAEGSREFLKQCNLLPTLSEATVVVLLPPGRIGAVLTGKLTKADVLKSLQSCAGGGGCGSGCSDRRFKKDIVPIEDALEKIAMLQGVGFAWDRDNYPNRFFPEGRQIGLIAQEVEPVIPEVVLTDAQGYKSVTYDKLTAVLIEAVKELKNQVMAQDALIKAQEQRIQALETDAKF